MNPDRDGMLGNSRDDVEFVLIAESGILEAQACLLCESIRRFAGIYSRAAITVVSPRSARRPSRLTLRKLDQLQAEYLPVEIDSCCPEYGTSYRVHSLAHIARRPGPPIIIQLDSDTIFLSEPDFALAGNQLAARPVDMKGMCTTGARDHFDPYWRKLCALVGVNYEQMPIVNTTIDHKRVRASYNGGLVAAQRAGGLFELTEDIFKRLVAAGMKPWSANGPEIMTGTGLLSGAATAYWGTSQAALSLATVVGRHSVRHLPATHNIPLHLLDRMTTSLPTPMVHVHYHWLFSADQNGPNPRWDAKLKLSEEAAEWLKARLPLIP
jgi:hypothetical protein